MNASTIFPETEGAHCSRHDNFARRLGGAIFGAFTGALLSTAFQTGLYRHFLNEQKDQSWGAFFWGEHWAWRVAGSLAATLVAGYAAGLVARKHGAVTAIFAALPGVLCWLGIAIIAWRGQITLFEKDWDFHASIGNKLAASILVICICPVAAWAGRGGAQDGQRYATQFDSRRRTLLGIRWYHYLWLPFFAFVWFAQAGWAIFYGFNLLKATWKSGFEFISVVPSFLMVGIFYSLAIMGMGTSKAYVALARLEPNIDAKARAWTIAKYGFGTLLLVSVIQFILIFIYLYVARWLSPD